ncbi:MAG: hypothetical protein ACQKBY_11690 [Verrucomicrobiales bacterium]
MKASRLRILLALILFFNAAGAAEFPPGAWNGQPWEAEKLAAGVAAGQADALAEWAYCNAEVLHGLTYDYCLAMQRALMAEEAGSVFGQALAGALVVRGWSDIQAKRAGLAKVAAAAEAGHPWAAWFLAETKRAGVVVEQDVADFEAVMKRCAEAGVRGVNESWYFAHLRGSLGVVDLEASRKFHRRAVMEDALVFCGVR